MYKKILNKLVSVAVALSMTVSLTLAGFSVPVYAVEVDGADEIDGYMLAPGIIDEYEYLDSEARLSFGQIKVTDTVDFQAARFTNLGALSHYFTVSVSPADMWEVDIPDKSVIDPEEVMWIYVRPNLSNPKWTEGEHTGVLTMSGYSASSGSISDTASVNLYATVYSESKPWVSSVSVSPSSVALSKNSTYTFRADVICGDGASSEVEWSVGGQTSGSTYIESNGTLHVASDEFSSVFIVRATSVQDKKVSGTASIGITKDQYTVNTQANPSNGGSTAGGGVYNSGQSTTVVANPANGYKFDGWYDANNNKVSSSPSYTFYVNSSQVLTAKFVQNSIRVNTKKNLDKAGNISESATIIYGGSYTATATVNAGYKFIGWYEGDKLLSNGTTLSLSGLTTNRELSAIYEQSSYEVVAVVNPVNTGSISGVGRYDKGSKVTLTANPANGYSVEAWIINNQVVGRDKTYTINNLDRDYSITVLFKQNDVQVKTYTIGAATDSANGSITPAGNTAIPEGKSFVVSIVPNKNYRISDVKVDGKSVGAVSSYIFQDIRANHTIVAYFAKVDTEPQKPASSAAVKPDKQTSDKPATNNQVQNKGNEVREACELTELTGVLQDLNVTPDEARMYIREGNDRMMMEDALYRGDLQVTVYNDYATIPNETAEASYYDIVSIPNIEDVIDSILSEDEKLELFQGTKVRTNLNISPMESELISEEEKGIFVQNSAGITIEDFFDVRFIAEVGGVPKLVTNLAEPLKIIMNVTPEMKAQGAGKYCVLRVHNGQFDILEDMDDDADTVTFITDRMSIFALAYYNSNDGSMIQKDTTESIQGMPSDTSAPETTQNKSDNSMLVLYIMIGVILMGVGVIVGVALSSTSKSKKKRKR